ncbi:hypothetical protein PoB_003439300 [Plakobranchus ocellatus]|uniref:Uncharacterized protein n=1 Tax=Plakobranchus ocellatus TaxID=259542 RepID=A0AAV4AMS5_9GAST|nr:hypothetical protein PoB_003439300 [Plakobranchus ocellatus]
MWWLLNSVDVRLVKIPNWTRSIWRDVKLTPHSSRHKLGRQICSVAFSFTWLNRMRGVIVDYNNDDNNSSSSSSSKNNNNNNNNKNNNNSNNNSNNINNNTNNSSNNKNNNK